MVKKRKQDGHEKAVASVMTVIGKLTGDKSLVSDATSQKASPTNVAKSNKLTESSK